MTGALRDPDEYARDAAKIDQWAREHHGYPPITEEQAARWIDGPRGYVGRRHAAEDGTALQQANAGVDLDVWDDLVSARVALVLRQPGDAVIATDRALQRLRDQGRTFDDALVEVDRLKPAVKREAERLLEGFGICPDPERHDELERGAAQEHRAPASMAAGCCPWCGRSR